MPAALSGPLSRRGLLLGGLGLAVTGCATIPPSPLEPRQPLTLVDAFGGRTSGRGVFVSPLTGTERRFTAELDGRLRGDTLTVVEDFVYDDGWEERLTWVFTRAGDGRWTGRRDDTIGEALVEELGDEIRLSYEVDFRSPAGTTRLGFADVIWRRPDGVIINDAIVTRLGIPVGQVRFELRRRG
ncbi:MAG: DUF3833 family protein [Rhodobacteraceae bacterium]|nr:DUF3833 family protein [Paracoccaceae bacterium]